MLSIDILICTYNGADRIPRTLTSLLHMRKPAGVDWRVITVDNNSKDSTATVLAGFTEAFERRLTCIFEPLQGKAIALNRGILSGTGDVVAMIDDDETVSEDWLEVIARTFADARVDYAGGPCVPVWPTGMQVPRWLPEDRPGILGNTFREGLGSTPLRFGSEFDGTLMGGNASIRRRMFIRTGLYDVQLGPTGERRVCSEDREMQERLIKSGGYGLFVPDMIIYHWIPAARVTKKHFRLSSYWDAYSGAMMDRIHGVQVPTIAGIPRWRIGAALRRLPEIFGGPSRRFSAELLWWDLAGYAFALIEGTGATTAAAPPKHPGTAYVNANNTTAVSNIRNREI